MVDDVGPADPSRQLGTAPRMPGTDTYRLGMLAKRSPFSAPPGTPGLSWCNSWPVPLIGITTTAPAPPWPPTLSPGAPTT